MTPRQPEAYTTADVLLAVEEIERHLAPAAVTDERHDGAECMAADVLATVAPAIAARALRDAARDLERRSGLFKLRPSDKVRRQTHADIAGHLRARADEIEANK